MQGKACILEGNLEKNNVITLVSLIVTVIIILILAGVTLSLSIGEAGIIGKAISAKKQHEAKDAFEKIQLAVTTA